MKKKSVYLRQCLYQNHIKTLYEKYFGNCKFRGCLHDSEPNCKVREAVKNGEIPEEHYQTYIEILHEILNRKERY